MVPRARLTVGRFPGDGRLGASTWGRREEPGSLGQNDDPARFAGRWVAPTAEAAAARQATLLRRGTNWWATLHGVGFLDH